MSQQSDVPRRSRTTRPSRQVFALSSGMTAWLVHLVGGSILVPATCEHGMGWTIDALTVATALVCGAGILVSLGLCRVGDARGGPDRGGVAFVGYVALMANLISLVLIVGEGAMHWFVEVCA